jgi:hypothetical protein
LIFSKTKTEYIKYVKKVLEKLKKANLLLKPEKCKFYQEELEFLGFIVRQNGIYISLDKVKAVLDWPALTTVKEVQAFLGFANFYRRFIAQYSTVAKPLIELTKKDQGFH